MGFLSFLGREERRKNSGLGGCWTHVLVCDNRRIVALVEVPVPEERISERSKRGLVCSVHESAGEVGARHGVA